jgi:polysaccharide biosynthesis protein PslJ
MGSVPAAGRSVPSAGTVTGIGAAVAILVGAAYVDMAPIVVAALLAFGLWAAVTHRFFLRWHALLIAVVLVIMFVPIGRYALPGSLPFQLEPYRMLVGLVAVGWLASMLVQPSTRYLPSGLGLPLGAFSVALLLSVGANAHGIHDEHLEPEVFKALSFFASFVVVLLMFNSLIRTRADLDQVLKAIVSSGALLGVLTVIESRTAWTPFNDLWRVLPILEFDAAQVPDNLEQRGSDFRAVASAQHPIALGALLAMVLPLGLYLGARFRGKLWWICSGLIALAVLTTVARTATLMLMIELVALILIKPREVFKLWPLALPVLVVVHILVPGTLGSLQASFFPEEGLIAEQSQNAGTYGSGRVADLGPGIQEWKETPYFGQGIGTRVTERINPKWNAPILDNQWLGWLLETGALGFIALIWLFRRSVRRMTKASKKDDSDHGWLLAAIAASLTAFALGMATYDAFAFVQVGIMAFILMGVGAAAVRLAGEPTAPSRVAPAAAAHPPTTKVGTFV